MGASILSTSAHVLGIDIPTMEVSVTNRTGGSTVEGDLHQFDMTLSDADVKNYIPGDSASAFANVIACAQADRDVGIFCVVKKPPEGLTSFADDQVMRVFMWGRQLQVQVNNAFTASVTGPSATTNGTVFYAPDVAPFDAGHIPLNGAGTELDAGTRRIGTLGKGVTIAASTVKVVTAGVFDGWGDALSVHRFGPLGS